MKGLLLLAGKPKGLGSSSSSKDEGPDSEPPSGASETESMALEDAYRAARDGDKAAFVSSMQAAIEACIERSKDGDY
jgi:hypothetical protein